jgi:hypothetical protein
VVEAATVARTGDACSAPTAAESAPPLWSRAHYALIAAFALLIMAVHAEVPTNTDIYWGARAGGVLLDIGHLPRSDTWSWTAYGHSWTPNSWGWNVVLALVYRSMGVVGFWVLGAALCLALASVVVLLAQRIGASPLPTITVFVPVAMFGTVSVPRAETLSTVVIPLLPVLTSVALRGGRRASTRAIALLALLEVAWVNLHGAALIGPGFVGAGALAIIARSGNRDRSMLLRRGAVATALTAACTLGTPFGVGLWTHAMDVRRASVGLISEWMPVGFGDLTREAGLVLVVVAPLLALRSWRRGRPEVAAAVLLLAVSGATAIRFLPMLVVVAAPELASLISGARVRAGIYKIIAAFMAIVLCALVVRDRGDIRSPGLIVSPKLVDALPHGCRLLNDDVVGSAVILFRPDIRVSLDGRNDMYGRAVLLEVLHMFDDRPGTEAALDRNHVGCVLGPSHTRLVERLSRDPGWRVVDHDIVRTLLVRTP